MIKTKKDNNNNNPKKTKKKKIFKNSLINFKVTIPKTTPQIIRMFFKNYDEKNNIIQLDDEHFSVCFEYQDISFAKANYNEQENIFLKWVDYLHSFNFNDHIQVVYAGKPVKTADYKKDYIYDTEILNYNEKRIADEFNTLIETTLGDKETILCETRQIVITTKAENIKDAQDIFMQYQLKTEEKFKELKSKIRRININERLMTLYNLFHTDLLDDEITNIIQYANNKQLSIYDVLSPQESVSLKEKNYINIGNKKFIRVLYVSKLPKSITPRFYNRITTINANIITTLNITPTDPAKVIQKVNKKISGMKTERLEKIKKANKNNYSYEAVKDEKLEDSIRDAQNLRDALQKKKQKLFTNNFLICIQADSLTELNKITKEVKSIGNEHLISIYNLDWQQLEGIQNCLPFGWNSLQIQRSLTSESTAANIPFNTKDLMHKNSIFYGINLVSKNPVFCDRKNLLNGNGCVLATSGAGKSFSIKIIIEQVLLKYAQDEVIVIDPQGEYTPLIKAFNGQTLNISTSTNTYINPFDSSLQYEKDNEDILNSKIEFVLAFIESIVSRNGLTGEQKTIVDRCTKNIYEQYQLNNFNEQYEPDFIKFYEELLKQPEQESKNLALVIERYVLGGMDIFAKKTNIEIKNRFISFDISELPHSIQTTGYLVVLEHIMNRLKRNKSLGKHTWIFIDEFHILLANQYSADYIAKIYKTGRKENAIPTIITQNIADVIQNEQGRKILSNSEFAIILKQKPLDLPAICKIFDISDEESRYVIDSPAGQGLIVYGEDKIAFRNQVPKDFYIYQLNQTSTQLNRS